MKYSALSLSLLELTSIACVCMLLAAIVNEAYGRSRDKVHNLQTRPYTMSLPESGSTTEISKLEARRLAQLAGLTGRQGLPPDIADTLIQGANLPPCFAVEPVPVAMFMALPFSEDHEWLIVGTELVLVSAGTDKAVSVLHGVFE